jgi:hypothetical protein
MHSSLRQGVLRRAWNAARALAIAVVVGTDLWLRQSVAGRPDPRLELLAALLILLIFAGRWRRNPFEPAGEVEPTGGLQLVPSRAGTSAPSEHRAQRRD